MAAPFGREVATIANDPYVPAFQTVLTPTDETLRNKGKGLELYDEIRRDPHAFALLQKRKLEVVSREWDVYEASDKRLDRKAAELVRNQFRALNFDQLTRGLMGAVLKGFAVAEVIWANIDGTWTAVAVKVKKQRRFRFTEQGELRMLVRGNMMDGVPVPERKFIVHRYSIDDDDDDPYGVGIGSVLYWPAWFKRQVLAHWLRSAERHAAPTVDASYEGSYDPKRQNEVLASVRKLANDGVIVHPSNVTIELLEAARGGGGDISEKLARYLDEMMSEAVLGETLSTNAGERGARSLGEVHNEVRIAIAKADADLVSATIKATLAQWIVELNLPGAQVPDVWRDFDEPEDLDKKAQRDKTLHDMGYKPKDVQYINDTYGGDWVKKEPPKPETPDPAVAGPTAGDKSKLDELFADRPATEPDEAESLADQLGTLAQPAIDAMVAAIRREVDQAVSYEDLATRLLRLGSEVGIDDLAALMEQAETVALLRGRESVIDEGRG